MKYNTYRIKHNNMGPIGHIWFHITNSTKYVSKTLIRHNYRQKDRLTVDMKIFITYQHMEVAWKFDS